MWRQGSNSATWNRTEGYPAGVAKLWHVSLRVPAKEIRPPLPRGRFLVVGLARSGQAAARMLAARGETVRAVDSGHPRGGGRAGGGRRRSLPGYGWSGTARGDADRRQEPGSSPGGAGDRRRAGAGDRGGGGGRARLAGAAEPLRRRHRHQRQDDHGRAARPPLPQRRRAGRGGRQRRHRALGAGRRGRPAEATIVCECSSFQLEDTVAFAPECAVFLNLAPDHLDRHRDLESYLAAKLRIFANQGNDDVAVYNADDPFARRRRPRRLRPPHRLLPRRRPRLRGRGRRGDDLLRRRAAARRSPSSASSASTTSPTRWPPPPRRSRWGSTARRSATGLRSFAGVPHRLERVAEIGGVRFVNDSKATNVASAAVGIRAFEGGVHAILGGSEKDEPFAPLIDPLRERARACYLIGATAERMARELAPVARGRGRAAPLRRPRGRGPPRRRRGRSPARSSCSRRPAPASTPSTTSKRAATASARSSGAGAMSAALARRSRRGKPGRRSGRRSARAPASRPSTTCCSPRPSACWRWGR